MTLIKVCGIISLEIDKKHKIPNTCYIISSSKTNTLTQQRKRISKVFTKDLKYYNKITTKYDLRAILI